MTYMFANSENYTEHQLDTALYSGSFGILAILGIAYATRLMHGLFVKYVEKKRGTANKAGKSSEHT